MPTHHEMLDAMNHEAVALSDEVVSLLVDFQRAQERPAEFLALAEVGLRQYVRKRGYVSATEFRPLRITPSEYGSGFSDVSINHDR